MNCISSILILTRLLGRHLLAVDLNKLTFAQLLGLAQSLAKEYFAPEPKQKLSEDAEAERDLRMFAFLTVLRLLRINMSHLVQWKIDPAECGFIDKHVAGAFSVALFSRTRRFCRSSG